MWLARHDWITGKRLAEGALSTVYIGTVLFSNYRGIRGDNERRMSAWLYINAGSGLILMRRWIFRKKHDYIKKSAAYYFPPPLSFSFFFRDCTFPPVWSFSRIVIQVEKKTVLFYQSEGNTAWEFVYLFPIKDTPFADTTAGWALRNPGCRVINVLFPRRAAPASGRTQKFN